MTNVNNLPSLPAGTVLETKPSRFKLIEVLFQQAHAIERLNDELDAIQAMPYEDRPEGDQSWAAVFSRSREHGAWMANCRAALNGGSERMTLDTYMHYSNQGYPVR